MRRLFTTRYSTCSPQIHQVIFVRYYLCPDMQFQIFLVIDFLFTRDFEGKNKYNCVIS